MVTEKITLTNPERFSGTHTISKTKLESAAEKAINKLIERNQKFDKDTYPLNAPKDYKYVPYHSNIDWQNGMWMGINWIAYELTGEKHFRDRVEYQLNSFRERLNKKIAMSDHDIGFMFMPSAVAAYKITGSEFAYKLAIDAADYLYHPNYSKEGKFIIRGVDDWDKGTGCRTMMDSLMNATLLFWAGRETGREELFQAGLDHCRTTEQLLIRADGSSYHHYQFDPATAKPVRGLTFQGNRDESTWSRGHSWGVYGFALAYNYTGEEWLKDVQQAVTYYTLNHLPDDIVPPWDYDFWDTKKHYKDASAGVITTCGLKEMASLLPDGHSDKQIYENAAAQLLESIIDTCTTDIGVEYDGLLHHVSGAVPLGLAIESCGVYADYFYLEALMRFLKPEWKRYW